MQIRKAAQRVSAWIAIVAIAMISIAPPVSQALSASGAAAGLADCAEHALPGHLHAADRVALAGDADADADADEPASSHASIKTDRCGYCSMHFSALELGAPPALPPGSSVPRFDVPHLLLGQGHAAFAWSAPQPRAPPGSGLS